MVFSSPSRALLETDRPRARAEVAVGDLTLVAAPCGAGEARGVTCKLSNDGRRFAEAAPTVGSAGRGALGGGEGAGMGSVTTRPRTPRRGLIIGGDVSLKD